MLKCMSHPWQNDIGGLLLQTFSLKGFVKKFLEGLFLRVFRHETPYFTRTSSGTEGSASTTSDIALCQFWQNTLMHGAASPLGETAMHSRLPSMQECMPCITWVLPAWLAKRVQWVPPTPLAKRVPANFPIFFCFNIAACRSFFRSFRRCRRCSAFIFFER